ncbi:MAG: sulfite exporter TauE/SafE family protein [Acetobacteraceae bacterium]
MSRTSVSPIADPLLYLLAVPTLLLVGISKGGFASGGGNLAVPAMSLVIAPAQAAGIVLPILCAMDVFGVWAYRRDWDRRTLLILTPGALAGIVLGTLAFGELSDRAVKALIGLIALGFVAHAAVRSRLARPAAATPAGEAPAKGLFWSAVSGFTSTLAHAGGPPLAIYLLPRRLPRDVLNATTIVFFAMVNAVKLVPYAWLGVLSPGNLATSAILLPTAPVGVWLGMVLSRRLSDALFYRLVYGLLLLTGVKLLHDGLAG